jgi:hypothetical protein
MTRSIGVLSLLFALSSFACTTTGYTTTEEASHSLVQQVHESFVPVGGTEYVWVQKTTTRTRISDGYLQDRSETKEILVCDAKTAKCVPVGVRCGFDGAHCQIYSKSEVQASERRAPAAQPQGEAKNRSDEAVDGEETPSGVFTNTGSDGF